MKARAETLGGDEAIIFEKGQRILEMFKTDEEHIDAKQALMVVDSVRRFLILSMSQRIGRSVLEGVMEKISKLAEEGCDCEKCDDLTCDKKIESIIKGE